MVEAGPGGLRVDPVQQPPDRGVVGPLQLGGRAHQADVRGGVDDDLRVAGAVEPGP